MGNCSTNEKPASAGQSARGRGSSNAFEEDGRTQRESTVWTPRKLKQVELWEKEKMEREMAEAINNAAAAADEERRSIVAEQELRMAEEELREQEAERRKEAEERQRRVSEARQLTEKTKRDAAEEIQRQAAEEEQTRLAAEEEQRQIAAEVEHLREEFLQLRAEEVRREAALEEVRLMEEKIRQAEEERKRAEEAKLAAEKEEVWARKLAEEKRQRLAMLVEKYMPLVIEAQKFAGTAWFKAAWLNCRKDKDSRFKDEMQLLQEQLAGFNTASSSQEVTDRESFSEVSRKSAVLSNEPLPNPYAPSPRTSTDAQESAAAKYERERLERAEERQKKREEELARLDQSFARRGSPDPSDVDLTSPRDREEEMERLNQSFARRSVDPPVA